MINKIVAVLVCFAFAEAVTAQQDPQYTQYMYNPVIVNPAYAGNRGVMSITGVHRSQWLGLDGAPQTQSLSVHTPITDSRLGIGLSVVNDEVGPSDETYIAADFSYTLALRDGARISAGIKAGFHVLNVDFGKLNPFDNLDPTLLGNVNNKFSPTVGLGLHYHTDRFYVGLSAPNLLETNHFNNSDTAVFIAQERIHYFITSGYVFDLTQQVKFKPATMVKMVSGAPLQVDLSGNFLFNEKFTVGAAYRWNAALSGMVAFQLTQQIMVGFAYDREVTRLGNSIFNDGSYELFARFELFNSYDKIITPRFF